MWMVGAGISTCGSILIGCLWGCVPDLVCVFFLPCGVGIVLYVMYTGMRFVSSGYCFLALFVWRPPVASVQVPQLVP